MTKTLKEFGPCCSVLRSRSNLSRPFGVWSEPSLWMALKPGFREISALCIGAIRERCCSKIDPAAVDALYLLGVQNSGLMSEVHYCSVVLALMFCTDYIREKELKAGLTKELS